MQQQNPVLTFHATTWGNFQSVDVVMFDDWPPSDEIIPSGEVQNSTDCLMILYFLQQKEHNAF